MRNACITWYYASVYVCIYIDSIDAMYVYIYMYVCMYIYMYICMYVCIYVYIQTHYLIWYSIYIYVFIYVYIFTYIYRRITWYFTRGSDQMPLNARFQSRSDASIIHNYGRLIVELAACVPDGMASTQFTCFTSTQFTCFTSTQFTCLTSTQFTCFISTQFTCFALLDRRACGMRADGMVDY
jgi:hypothetical protein